MIQRYSLLGLVFACCCFGNARAQSTIAIEIGTGTGTGTYQPIASYYNSSATESVYLANELNYAGEIKKIAYYKGSGTSTIEPQVKIYMAMTTRSNVGATQNDLYSVDTNNYTLIYEGALPNNSTSGWMEVTLQTPFTYDNTRNLAVLVISSTCISSGRPQFRYTTQSDRKAGTWDDGSIGCDGTNPWSLSSSFKPLLERANIKLTIDTTGTGVPPVNTLSAPVATSAGNIGTNTFTANWNSVTSATEYLLDVSTSNSFSTFLSGYNNFVISGTSSTVSGLQANTNYYYRVRARNASATSVYSNIIALTTNGSTTSIQDVGTGNTGLRLYPNPVKDKLYLGLNGENNYTIKVYNVWGACVLETRCATGNSIPVGHLAAGIYRVQVQTSGGLLQAGFTKPE